MGALAERAAHPVGDSADVLMCFEDTASTVFLTLSHLTAGDREFTEQLFAETYAELRIKAATTREVTTEWLLATAHQLYTERARSVTGRPASTDTVQPSNGWASAEWGAGLDALGALEPIERAVLHLHVAEGITIQQAARVVCVSEETATAALARAEDELATAHLSGDEHVIDAFRHAELWLDDASRERVRAMLRDDGHHRATTTTGRSRDRALKVGAIGGAVVLVVAVVVWISATPEDGAPLDFSGSGASTTETTSTEDSAVPVDSRVPGNAAGYSYLVPPVPNALNTAAFYLSADLTDVRQIVPELIVRYPGDRIGLAWKGPCDEPAAVVQIATLEVGAAVRLMTGKFPVLACTGMPEQWSMVVHSPLPLPDGPIAPVGDNGDLRVQYIDYHELSDGVPALEDIPDGDFGSALVDLGSHPWVYGAGCAATTTRYPSPGFPIFEVRVDTDSEAPSTGDDATCDRLRDRQLLVGPDGATFPQASPVSDFDAPPVDCDGPFMSPTDVPVDPAVAGRDFYDSVWTTWESCLVNSDVIYTRDLSGQCGWRDVHTITFSQEIGDRILTPRALTYVRDPEGTVVGSRPINTSVALPEDAVDTGLRYDGVELWISPTTADSIYLLHEDGVEEWPRLYNSPTC